MTTMWNQPAEGMSRDERAALQSQRLTALVSRLLDRSPFYRQRLGDAGVQPGQPIGLDDLPSLPFTTKRDLWDHYPWGMLTVPREEVVRVHGSSGTGGRPTLVGYSHADLALWAEVCARSLGCAGAIPGTVVQVAYGYGLFTGGLGLHGGAELMGCTVVPTSSGQSARQVLLLRDLGAEVLCCTPSYAARLGEVLVEEGIDPGELRLRAGVFGAEPWTQAMRTKIEALLGLKALDIYGLSEIIGPGVACECVEGQTTLPESPTDGVRCTLHVNEDHFLVEVVDPATGTPVPPRSRGELVFTTLTREAMPVLRYRTGDIAAIDSGPCVCGRTLVRMSKIVGRADDMLVIRGVNVYPSEVEAVLLAEPALGPHYLLVVDRTETMPSLVVVCEQGPASPGGERDRTGARITAALQRR
ncbi:MAG TPA: phenylacetate--CoA ligase, partial [Actinomycetes bacterium]|nr:phenylacetate--CoA ligase [Actinomycetes bacterium]